MIDFRFVILIFILTGSSIFGQQIILDENYDDWLQNGISSFSDPISDAGPSGIDLTDIKISNDEDHLFLYVDLSKEMNLQSSNNLVLYIDTDNNPNTGFSKNGIGAEIVYFFGSRNGVYYGNSFSRQIYHNNINLITLPTVTSDKFEMSLTRKFTYGSFETAMANNIKVIFSDESINGDRAPNQNGGYLYTFNSSTKNQYPTFSITKQDPNHLRILSYNVLKDNLFNPLAQSAYKRIFEATKPDIIGFCEIYDYSSKQTADLVASYLPSTGAQKWYHSEVNPDIRVVSRYPVIDKRSIDGNGAFLIDLGTKQVVFIVVHFPCCDNETDRQKEVDKVMAFVRSVRYGVSPFQVPQNTPIIICGDTNLVGLRSQQQTLITGDIKNNSLFGEDFDPDWDDTQLEDAKPKVTNLPSTFTWNNPYGSFSAGRLDYMFYTGSTLKLKNAFSLWTPTLTLSERIASGLQIDDIATASDHLPIICDFYIDGLSDVTETNQGDSQIKLTQNGDELTVFFNENLSNKEILLTDMMGRVLIRQNISQFESQKVINFTQSGLNSIYILSVKDKNDVKSIRFFR